MHRLFGIAAIAPLLLFAALATLIARTRVGRREAAIAAATFLAGWLVAGTELLGTFHALRFAPVLVWWLAPLAVTALLPSHTPRATRERVSLEPLGRVFATAVAAILLVTFVEAVATPPNTYDSLSYHLPRQISWIQERSVAFTSTSNPRRLYMPPLAEFAQMHLTILSGDDRLNGLVQWGGLLLALAAVSLIARSLGASRSGQWLAALVATTIPMAFVQASSTKNDLVVSMWLAFLAHAVLRDEAAPTLLVGLAFGALLLTKGTGFIFAVPVGVAFAYRRLRTSPLGGLRSLGAVALIVAALNGCHWARNIRQFGRPTGPSDSELLNRSFGPRTLLSNVLRNLAPHIAMPIPSWNESVFLVVKAAHDAMGLDLNDPGSTAWSRFESVEPHTTEEDLVASPGIVLAFLVVAPLALLARRAAPATRILASAAIPIAAFVLFSLVLKWQIWHVRLLLPVFVLAAPVVAAAVASSRVVSALLALGLLVALAPTFWSAPRNLRSVLVESVDARFFAAVPELREPCRAAADRCAELGARVVALRTEGNFPDYLIERTFRRHGPRSICFVDFDPNFVVPGHLDPAPDVVVSKSEDLRIRTWRRGPIYAAVAQFGSLMLYQLDRPGLVRLAPSFDGWDEAIGLDPGKANGEPRWGHRPWTRLIFESDGSRRELLAVCRPNAAGERVGVRLNGVLREEHVLSDSDFATIRTSIQPIRGPNELILEYGPGAEETPAVLYRELRILRSSEAR